MDYLLNLADVRLEIESERILKVEEEWKPFLEEPDKNVDQSVKVTWDWKKERYVEESRIGQDPILRYYKQGEKYYCVTNSDAKEPVTSVSYKADLSEMVCAINEEQFLTPPDSIGRIIRAIPIREILLQHDTLFFHASQVAYNGKGILFAAPSGTGKTTQAKLWQKFKRAEVVCNDRTLVRKRLETYKTYGFPLDGSEPVASTSVNELGAIILLNQSTDNRVEPLKAGKKLSMLMEQLVMDCWNPSSHERNMNLLLELIKEIPVYRFHCTPDEQAVEVLYEYLVKNEVI